LRGKRLPYHNTVPGINTVFLLAWKGGQITDKEQGKIHLKITWQVYIGISESLYFSS